MTGEDVSRAIGKEEPDERVVRAFEYLDQAKYIDASFAMGFGLPFQIRATEKGLQHCAGWPSPGSSATFLGEFLSAIEARASDAATPEDERGRLRRFLEAASGVPKELLTDVAAKIIERQAGL